MILFHPINYNDMEKTTTKTKKVVYPEYWAKRKNRLNPLLVKELEESAAREPEVTDDYGKYKPGTFLFKNTVVTVKRSTESGWSLHIFSEHPIGLHLIKEVRYTFLPDKVLMAQLFGTREDRHMKGVVLYEIPQPEPEEEAAE
jgi:hypothetical protein